ncbi:MAG: efflux RND transporter permease subunit [Acidobacteriota bacterium]
MSLPGLSIRRPVLATVINLLIVVLGLAAWQGLPIREYPDVDVPVVSISTAYFGASPSTVESTITEPIEQGLGGIEGLRAISSQSAFGSSTINIEFEAGRDLDLAATDVSNAVQRAVGRLPLEAEQPVIYKNSGGGSGAIMWITLFGEGVSSEDKTDIADRLVKTPLQLLPGIAQVMLGGERRYAMRIWLDPARMAARGVEASDVRRAVRANNLQVPAGQVEGEGRKFIVNVDAQVDDPRVYERLVIRRDGDAAVRVQDVGWVELGSSNYETITRSKGKPTVGIGIIAQSTANELDVSRAVRAALPEIEKTLPEGMSLFIGPDNTVFVEESLGQAFQTLLVVFGLVMIVNLIFLRSLTTTLICSVAIPISLVGTLAVMFVLGFSLNVLTVLGLVLAIGMLVDDSIVVLENIYRRQENGETPHDAAFHGAREVAFPVLATTAAVVAVLVPLAAIQGNTGRLFREFSWTMAAAVCISTFVALTMVPMACALYLRLSGEHGAAYRAIESVLDGLARVYGRALEWSVRHRWIMAVAMLATIGGVALLLRATPATLVPTEDRGTFMTFLRAPQGSTAAYTDRALRQAEEHILALPELHGNFAAVAMSRGGGSDTASGIIFARLKDWDERQRSQQEIVADLFPKFMAIPEAMVFPINPPSLGGGGNQSDIEVILRSSSASLDDFRAVVGSMLAQMREIPGLINVDSDLRFENPQLDVSIDREVAADLGLSAEAVADSVRLLVSEGPADEFILRNKQYDVVMSLAPRYKSFPEQLSEIHLRTSEGAMVPLSQVARSRPTVAPASLNHHDLVRSATLTASLAPGATMGAALPAVLDIAERELPPGFTTALGGVSREFVESTGAIYMTFALALLIIFLVLAAQFESFLHPLTVLLSVPLACLGALAALNLLGHTLNIYSAIGIILLVGLVTKNSILLVDFANQERARGAELMESLIAAGKTRFRPILMTSVTSILGALPLAFATGAGAESRQPIGAAVLGGLLFSTVFTLLIIPAIHLFVVKAGERLGLNMVPPLVDIDRPTGLEESTATAGG